MKNQVLLPIIILFTLFAYQVQAQCPTGNTVLATQAQVDNFITSYPMCQNLIGSMHIGGSGIGSPSDITDISGLQLTTIGGDLKIQHNPNLSNLDGLDMLTTVSGGLTVFNNALLTNIDFVALASIGKNLTILNNDMMTSITGLNQLTSIGTSINISYNMALTSLAGLEGITGVATTITIEGNNALTNLTGLDNLESVGSDIDIRSNTQLLTLDGLESLQFVGGSVYLFANIQMTSIAALANLVDVCGNFQIFKNYTLTDCAIGILCKFIEDENFDLFLDENMPTCGTVASVTSVLDAANVDCVAATTASVLCNPLSTELVDLDVRLQGRTATLTWETATETDNQGFEIQRSKDGSNWETISWQEGNGNSNTLRAYAYTDYNTYRGINYYRLRQLDFDGAAAYSPAVSVTINSINTIDIYPNPANDFLVVSGLGGRAIDEIIIHNITGKQALRRTNTNNIIDISSLPAGMYVAVIVAGFDEKFLKLVIE